VFGFLFGAPAQVLFIGRLRLGLLGLELLPAAPQPLDPRAAIDKLLGQFVAACVAVLGVLGRVSLSGLGEDPLDLLTDRGMRARGCAEALPAISVPSSATVPTDTNPALAQSASTLVNVAASALLMPNPKARDRRVIGNLVGADHPKGDIPATAPLDRSRGPLSVGQQRDHHRRLVRRPHPSTRYAP